MSYLTLLHLKKKKEIFSVCYGDCYETMTKFDLKKWQDWHNENELFN